MNEFTTYLQGRNMKDSTIREHVANIRRFISWLTEEQHLDAGTIRYTDLLAYIQWEKGKGLDIATINLRLTSISHYFECLKKEGIVGKNPARTLRVKGTIKKVVENPLPYAELGILYQQYEQLRKTTIFQAKTDLLHQRNLVILGLLIWQGVHAGELHKMDTGNINLTAGTVYVPSTRRSNSRELPLSFMQMLPLNKYLEEIRPLLRSKGDKLIPGDVSNLLALMMLELQGINPAVRNALHIRASVILHWLTLHNKREVQYMAGHKYISSTEKYAAQEMGSLTDQLTKYHPFG